MRLLDVRSVTVPHTDAEAGLPPFDLLLRRHEREIGRYIHRLVRGGADADDLCQETFLRAYRAYGRLAGQTGAHPRAWLYRIASNVCLDYLRRQRREQPLDRIADHPSEAASVEQQAEARQDAEQVQRLIRQLPGRQRDALVLRRLQGLSYEEVASAMGGTAEAARANVYQAAKRLKGLFDAAVSAEGSV